MTRFVKRRYWLRIDNLYNNAKRARGLLGDLRSGPSPEETDALFEMIEAELQALQLESRRINRDLILGEHSQDQIEPLNPPQWTHR